MELSNKNELEKEIHEHWSKKTTFWGAAAEGVKLFQTLHAKGLDWLKIDDYFRRTDRSCSIRRMSVPETRDRTERFTYDPLTEPNMFRILLLHQGVGADELEGSLQHSVLGPMIDYHALSYAWGDDSMPCSMLLNGRQMRLTQSLYDALRNLRYPHKDRPLWVDGICINQADNAEKSIQVSLIPQIYNQAVVWAYLGAEADNSEILPDLLEKLADVDLVKPFEQSVVAANLPPPDDPKWPALLALLSRPWFRRLWVAQEVILARDVRFVCGDWELGWRGLYEAANIVNSDSKIDILGIRGLCPIGIGDATWTLSMMLSLRLGRSSTSEKLQELRECITERKHSKVDTAAADYLEQRELVVQACIENPCVFQSVERLARAFPSVPKHSRTEILRLFTMFMRSQVTYPQDRLYALVGLANDITLTDYPPDYNESVEEANVRFCKVMVEKGQGMDVLYHATNLVPKAATVPSWTVNWTSSRTWNNHWLKLHWAYKSGYFNRRLSGSLVSLVNDDMLKVSGHQLDVCRGPIISFPELKELDVSDYVLELFKFVGDSKRIICDDDDRYYFTGESWAEVYHRTLVVGDEVSEWEDLCSKIMKVHLEVGDIDLEHVKTTLQEWRSEQNTELLQSLHNLGELWSHFFPGEHPILECFADVEGLQTLFREWQMKQHHLWLNSMVRTMSGYSVCKTSKSYLAVVPKQTIATDAIFMLEGSDTMPFVLRPIPSRPGHYNFIGGCYVHGSMNGKAWESDHVNKEIFLV